MIYSIRYHKLSLVVKFSDSAVEMVCHLAKKHFGQQPYKCHLCKNRENDLLGAYFGNVDEYKSHLEDVHPSYTTKDDMWTDPRVPTEFEVIYK